MSDAVDMLYMLTSFESFDALAGATRSPEEVVPLIQRPGPRGSRPRGRVTG